MSGNVVCHPKRKWIPQHLSLVSSVLTIQIRLPLFHHQWLYFFIYFFLTLFSLFSNVVVHARCHVTGPAPFIKHWNGLNTIAQLNAEIILVMGQCSVRYSLLHFLRSRSSSAPLRRHLSSCAYLQDRAHVVTANEVKSSVSLLTYGVPHGSVQGPVLFILYTQTLSDVRWWPFWLQLTECRMAFGWHVLNCTNLPILLKLSLCHGPSKAASVSDVTVRVVRINFIWKTTDQTEIFVLGRTRAC